MQIRRQPPRANQHAGLILVPMNFLVQYREQENENPSELILNINFIQFIQQLRSETTIDLQKFRFGILLENKQFFENVNDPQGPAFTPLSHYDQYDDLNHYFIPLKYHVKNIVLALKSQGIEFFSEKLLFVYEINHSLPKPILTFLKLPLRLDQHSLVLFTHETNLSSFMMRLYQAHIVSTYATGMLDRDALSKSEALLAQRKKVRFYLDIDQSLFLRDANSTGALSSSDSPLLNPNIIHFFMRHRPQLVSDSLKILTARLTAKMLIGEMIEDARAVLSKVMPVDRCESMLDNLQQHDLTGSFTMAFRRMLNKLLDVNWSETTDTSFTKLQQMRHISAIIKEIRENFLAWNNYKNQPQSETSIVRKFKEITRIPLRLTLQDSYHTDKFSKIMQDVGEEDGLVGVLIDDNLIYHHEIEKSKNPSILSIRVYIGGELSTGAKEKFIKFMMLHQQPPPSRQPSFFPAIVAPRPPEETKKLPQIRRKF